MENIRVAIVVARAKNGVIGRAGGLPWRLKSDMAHFKAVTMGKPIIMGRTTWGSLPRKPLPGRMNIVITRNADYVAEGALVVTSIEQAIEVAKLQAAKDGIDEVCVIGGAQIYTLALPYTNRIYLTEVDAEVEGDAVFPTLNATEWQEISREAFDCDVVNDFSFSFRMLDKK